MLRTIGSAEPLPPSRIRRVWGDSTESVIELGPVPGKGGVFSHVAARNMQTPFGCSDHCPCPPSGDDALDLADATWSPYRLD